MDNKAESAIQGLYTDFPALDDVIKAFPVTKSINMLSKYDERLGYSQLKPRLANLSLAVVSQFGEELTLRYGLAILGELIRSHEIRWSERPLDPELKPEFVDSFHRILKFLNRGGEISLQLNTDAYAKELAICLHRLIPAGGQMLDPGSGIPRRFFFTRPFLSSVRAALYILRNSRGVSPFCELHTNVFMRHYFSAEGWEYCFRLLPAVFRSYAKLRGLMASSWIFDPKVAEISPNLEFVRATGLRWGGRFIRINLAANPTDALAMSPKRKALFENGDYVPTVYALLLPKSAILRHAAIL